MPGLPQSAQRLCFGRFALNLKSGELHSDGQKILLPPKAFEVLAALVERPGEVVTREELRSRLWPADTYVEFDDSLNHAVKRLRRALGDTAEEPQLIETLPRRGYRLVARVETVTTKETESPIRSLAVLPLANLSDDPGQDYFVDGMTDALITNLSKLRTVKVISRTSVMQFKEVRGPLPKIASQLGVEAVVEGTVQRSGRVVRITVQLIRAATDTHLWAQSYERDLRDVLTLQGEVARAVAREIKATLAPEESAQLSRAQSVNSDAYEAYLQGQFYWHRLSAEHLDRALSYFQLATERDSNYAPAFAGIANAWFSLSDTGVVRPTVAFPKAREAVLKALDLDETLAEAHITLANIKTFYDHDWLAGEREFRRGVELNPNSADGHLMFADFLISTRRCEEWAAVMQRVLELDPANPFFQCFYGWHLVYLSRCDEAIAQLRKVLKVAPNFPAAHMALWGAFYRKGMHEEAMAEAQEFFASLRDHEVKAALARSYASSSYSKAMRAGAETLVVRSALSHVPSVRIARLYAHAGENDQVFLWLNKAYEEREGPLGHLGVGWDWDVVRGDPRFQELLQRIGLPEQTDPPSFPCCALPFISSQG